MENITHSLMGATLAELALPASATPTQRRIFFITGIVAANLPDADLIYTRIMPPPLGYLLHHRGHTHTLVGLVPLALLIGVVCLLPRIREHVAPVRSRLWTLIGAALLSHIVLDSWNSYGVHPFWPIDARWYYGDVISIFEPWLWVLLGVAATRNTRNIGGRIVLGGALTLLVGTLAVFKAISIESAIALAVAAFVLAAVLLRRSSHATAGTALGLTVLFVAAMFGLHQQVRAGVVASLRSTSSAPVIDVILSPNAANPFCWRALAITRDDRAGEYVMTRGNIAPFTRGCDGAQLKWDDTLRQSLPQLRELNRRDCHVRAWMQFGRAPEIHDDSSEKAGPSRSLPSSEAKGSGRQTISDRRFGASPRGNFTSMLLQPSNGAAACPANMTNWGVPRADLL